MAFIAPLISLVAERVRSVGVVSGASRLCRSSAVFVEPFLGIMFFFLLLICSRSGDRILFARLKNVQQFDEA
jgi:hypothetical protein